MLELIQAFVDFVLHIDRHLVEMAARFGAWLYVVLAAIVFAGVIVALGSPNHAVNSTEGVTTEAAHTAAHTE